MYRVGVAGTGFIAVHKHLPAWRTMGRRAKVVALCDTDPDRRQRVAQRFEIPRASPGLAEMLYFEASQDPGHPLRGMLGQDIGITWRQGMLDWGVIQTLRNQHRLGRRDNSYELFAVIMFDVWWQKYIVGILPRRTAAAVGIR